MGSRVWLRHCRDSFIAIQEVFFPGRSNNRPAQQHWSEELVKLIGGPLPDPLGHPATPERARRSTGDRLLVNKRQVAYVWHASVFTREVLNGLLRIGFLYPQQIIWNKGRVILTRTHYCYQHEPCWYVRKKNAPWYGKAGENSTIWASPSPKFVMGGSDETKFDHPTQKPVELMRRPILNHTKRGELAYDPFLGSGTTLAAAELAERVCCGMELDPKYVDVIVRRWQDLSGKKATLEADGRSFEEIARERRTAA